MKKIVTILFLVHIALLSFSQHSNPCADSKLSAHTKPAKKSRAGSYDNILMAKYDVHFYFLELNAERNTTVISGATTMGANVLSTTLDTFCFELNPSLVIDSIVYNNQILSFTRFVAITYAQLPSGIVSGSNISVKIFYHGDASVTGAGAIGDGFSTGTSGSWGNRATWSLSEPFSAYEWFPCKQSLQDKADSAWVFVTTDSVNKVGSNGLLEGVDNIANKKRYRWKTHYIIDYYLISVAIARYVDYTIYAHPTAMMGDSIPIVNYVYNNTATLPFFKAAIDSVPMVLEYYSDLFGLYPFHDEKYGHCMAPFGGGMEHQTMTSIGNLGSFSTNSHELMHQWFGDHVTCKTWKDIFINEGFASYGEYLAFEKFRGLPAAQSLMLDVHDNVLLDSTAMVYFTDTTDVGRIFSSRLTYDKGNAVIHTLRFVMGDSLFFNGLKQFQQSYSFSTASIDDLKLSLESSSGINLTDYFNQWIYGEGYPVFSAEYASDSIGIYLNIDHITSSAFTTLFKTPLQIKCKSLSGDTTVTVSINQNYNLYMIPSTKIITGLEIDPNNYLLNKVGIVVKNDNLIPLSASTLALENSIEFYPNPTSSFVVIHCKQALQQANYALYDLTGKMMQSGILSNHTIVDLSQYATGVYQLQVQSSLGRLTKKLVKM